MIENSICFLCSMINLPTITAHTNVHNTLWLLQYGISFGNTVSTLMWNLVRPWLIAQLFNRFEILHKARQYHCRVKTILQRTWIFWEKGDFERFEFKVRFELISYRISHHPESEPSAGWRIRCQGYFVNWNLRNKLQWNFEQNTVSFAKMHLKMPSAKWRPFCPGKMS